MVWDAFAVAVGACSCEGFGKSILGSVEPEGGGCGEREGDGGRGSVEGACVEAKDMV